MGGVAFLSGKGLAGQPGSTCTRPLAARTKPALGLCLILAACSPFPDIATLPDDGRGQPALQPLDGLLAQADALTTDDPGPALIGRAAGLKARTDASR